MIEKSNNCAIDLLKLIYEKIDLDDPYSWNGLNMNGAVEILGKKYSIEEISFASEILSNQGLITIRQMGEGNIDDIHKIPKFYYYDSITSEGQELVKSITN